MKRPILIALLAAVPIEAINIRLCVPLDVGLPPNSPWYINLLEGQWVWMHLPTILVLGWLQGMALLRVERPLLFVNGYLETALLFIAAIFLFRWFRELAKKFCPIQA